MKKFAVLLFTLLISVCSYGQTHYFTTNPVDVFGRYGLIERYIFSGEYIVYHYNDDGSLSFLTTQEATILINDELGYYSIIFNNSKQLEVYEFEYKKAEWDDDILFLESKDVFGVKIAILAIWDDEYFTNLTLFWYDKNAKDTLLYYITLETNPILW